MTDVNAVSDNQANGLPPQRPILRKFAKVVCLATLILIFMGGLVKSHDAGLSVVGWPGSDGHNMFTYPLSKWIDKTGVGIDGKFWEHSHRLVATLVGVLTLLLSVFLVFRDKRLWVGLLGFGALFLVIVQGVLGGVTVLMGLPTWVSVLHGVIAQAFLVIMIILAYSQSVEFGQRKAEREYVPRAMARWSAAVFALVFVQLIVAAVMRHSDAGLAIPDFPQTAGRLVPILNQEALEYVNSWRHTYSIETQVGLKPVTMGQMHIHFTHRVFALFIVLAAGWLTYRAFQLARGNKRLLSAVVIFDVLVIVQVCLGAWTIWSARGPWVTSLHVLAGAATLGWSALMLLRAVSFGEAPQEEGVASVEAKTVTA